jgi:hypothetical protein
MSKVRGPQQIGGIAVVLDGSHGGIYSMAAVLISCPRTGALVPTGANVEEIEELEPTNLLIDCPDCGADHEWTPVEAVLSVYTSPKATAISS